MFFLQWMLPANSAGDVFSAQASIPVNNDEFKTERIDHQITQNQRIYWRILHLNLRLRPSWAISPAHVIDAGEDTHFLQHGP